MAPGLTLADCLSLAQSPLLSLELLRQVVVYALKRRHKAPAGQSERLEQAIRGCVIVPGFADPLAAPLADLVRTLVPAALECGPLLQAILETWAASRTKLSRAVVRYLDEHGSESVAREDKLRQAAAEIVWLCPQFREDEAALMLVWQAGRLPEDIGEGTDGPRRNDQSSAEDDAAQGERWPLCFVQLLADLGRLPRSDPAWNDLDWFIAALSRLRQSVRGAPIATDRGLEAALSGFNARAAGDLAHFGLAPLSVASQGVAEIKAESCQDLARLEHMLAAHRQIRAQHAERLSEELFLRSRLAALESQIVQAYERLRASLGDGEATEADSPPPLLEQNHAGESEHRQEPSGCQAETGKSQMGPASGAEERPAGETISGRPPYVPRWKPLDLADR